MKSIALHGISPTDRAGDGSSGSHDRARTRREAVPPLLAQLAALGVSAVLAQLGASESGLSAAEVQRRRAECGVNRIAHERREPLVRQVLRRLANPLNLLLLALAGVSMAMGDRRAALIIFVMVILSLGLATVQERRSSRAAERLREMVHTTAAVIRAVGEDEGAAAPAGPAGIAGIAGPEQAVEIPIEELVPGDIVHLSAGDMIPADLRLIAAKDLFINQASLTGESLPVEKHAAVIGAAADISVMSNICFMGTTGKLELRQHVQRHRRERLAAVPADGARAGTDQQPAL